MSNRKQRFGSWGEQVAASFLAARGYEIIGRNIRTPYGEIDLIVKTNEILVFVEVKTRSSDSFGMPEGAIGVRKRDHMLKSAQYYLQEKVDYSGDWRIDVIAVRGVPNQVNPEIVWFENALE